MAKDRMRSFTSVADFIADCDRPHHASWNGITHKNDAPRDWCGGVDYAGAKALALHGWETGLKQATERLSLVRKDTVGRSMQKYVAGSHPDVGRFLAGMPDCMNRRHYSESVKKPCLDVVVMSSFASDVNKDYVMNYGVAIASFIDQLENSGYSIALTAGVGGSCRGCDLQAATITLKAHGEAVDLGRLIYFIAHPSFLRVLGLINFEVHNSVDDIGYGYGGPMDLPKAMQGDLYFGKLSESGANKCPNMERASAYVHGVIKAQRPDLLNDELEAA